MSIKLVDLDQSTCQGGAVRRDIYTLNEERDRKECCMQNELHMERKTWKQGGNGIFEELKSNGVLLRVEEE